MAVTLSARSGSSFRTIIEYHEPTTLPNEDSSTTPLIDTTGWTARLQLRSASGNRRVLLSTSAGPTPSPTALFSVDETPGRWHVLLPASITKALPPVVYLEVDLVNDENPDDVVFLFSGTLYLTPEQVQM